MDFESLKKDLESNDRVFRHMIDFGDSASSGEANESQAAFVKKADLSENEAFTLNHLMSIAFYGMSEGLFTPRTVLITIMHVAYDLGEEDGFRRAQTKDS